MPERLNMSTVILYQIHKCRHNRIRRITAGVNVAYLQVRGKHNGWCSAVTLHFKLKSPIHSASIVFVIALFRASMKVNSRTIAWPL